ncbi:MAG: carbohydrate kinase [Prevotella sp.]|nr:carbohydrate kinase [Prevotella sp.]
MIIGLGETVYDIIFKNDQPVKGVPGGSAFNAMISLGRCMKTAGKGDGKSSQCLMVTETGDDHIGDIVVQFLKDNGVGTEYVYRHPDTKSHISLAFLDNNNDARYQFYKDHAALNLPNRMPEISQGDIVLFGSFFAINPVIREYVSLFLRTAKEKGAILYYDINFRASHKHELPEVIDNIEENMRLATVVRGSAEDFSILYDTTTGEEAYKRIRSLCDVFIYTDAANPVQVFMPDGRQTFSVPQVETVSTIGAGDNFNAGFCHELYNIIQNSKEAISSLIWREMPQLVASGTKFSAEVCQSFDNYINKAPQE